jgi:hypothetical protein
LVSPLGFDRGISSFSIHLLDKDVQTDADHEAWLNGAENAKPEANLN